MTDEAPARPVLVVDGARFDDLGGFAREFSGLLVDHTWEGGFDAFNDILRGGFGTPDGGWTLRWLDSARSRGVLGHPATADWLERRLADVHPANRAHALAALDRARHGDGPTLFDLLVGIIREHGPGGSEAEDDVLLELL